MRVVFDTNIYIAAALRGSFAEDIIDFAATTNLITLVTSQEILNELREKLLSKFDESEINVAYFINSLKDFVEVVEIVKKVDIIKRDPDDNKILECTLASNADLIVSSDQDLLDLKTFQGIGIIHPRTLSWTFPKYFKKSKK